MLHSRRTRKANRKFNGEKNCYTSVYVFDDQAEVGGKTNYESAAINTMWFRFR